MNIGRPDLRPHIVTVGSYVEGKGLVWDDERAVALANRKYEAGTHELCQGRDGDFIIQYCIPRKQPAKPRSFPWAAPLAERIGLMIA